MQDVWRLSLASGDDIRRLAFGEVASPEEFQPGARPVPRGLYCEVLFGRDNDWECACGRLRGEENVGYICIRCDRPVLHLRSTRFGRIDLSCEVVHPLFYRALRVLLDYAEEAFRRIVYYMDFVVVDAGDTPLKVGQAVNQLTEIWQVRSEYGDRVRLASGAEACRQLLGRVSLPGLRLQLRERIHNEKRRDERRRLRRRLRVVEAICRAAPDDPDGYARRMLVDCLAVIPPAARRPLARGGAPTTDDINTFYARLVNRRNRHRRLVELSAPEVIVWNEQRMLQLDTDTLFDNFGVRRPAREERRPFRKLRSHAQRLGGPLQRNLLHKAADYSACGVAVADPGLRVGQCGLPARIGWELFRTHLLAWLAEEQEGEIGTRARQLLDLLRPRVRGGLDEAFTAGMRLYRELVDELRPRGADILREVMAGRRVVVTARTSEEAGLVAVEPILVEGSGVRLHPEVGRRLGIGLSGETVRLHLPLSNEAQLEAARLGSPGLPEVGNPPSRGGAPEAARLGSAGPPTFACFTAAGQVRRRLMEDGQHRRRCGDLRRLLVAALDGVVIREEDCGAGVPGLLACRSRHGACRRCYAANGPAPQIGDVVGVRAALAIAAAARSVSPLLPLWTLLEAWGPPPPGRRAAWEHLLGGLRGLCRDLDDRHLQLLVARMLGRVAVRHPGDSGLSIGSVVERSFVAAINDRLRRSVVVVRPGQLVSREAFEKMKGRPAVRDAALPRVRTVVEGLSRMVRRRGFLAGLLIEEPMALLAAAALEGREDDGGSLQAMAARGGSLWGCGTGSAG